VPQGQPQRVGYDWCCRPRRSLAEAGGHSRAPSAVGRLTANLRLHDSGLLPGAGLDSFRACCDGRSVMCPASESKPNNGSGLRE